MITGLPRRSSEGPRAFRIAEVTASEPRKVPSPVEEFLVLGESHLGVVISRIIRQAKTVVVGVRALITLVIATPGPSSVNVRSVRVDARWI